MARTFVYNAGNPKQSIEDIHLQVGVLFDGTANNFTNTMIRKKYYQIEEGKDQSKPENKASQTDRQLTKKFTIGKETNLLTMKKENKINSYTGDFSNVARQYMCCDKIDYAIYIEGIRPLMLEEVWRNLPLKLLIERKVVIFLCRVQELPKF